MHVPREHQPSSREGARAAYRSGRRRDRKRLNAACTLVIRKHTAKARQAVKTKFTFAKFTVQNKLGKV